LKNCAQSRRRILRRCFCALAALGLFLGAMARGRSDFIYLTNSGNGDIRRANLDGTGQISLVSGQDAPLGIALYPVGGLIYWTNFLGGDIRRANLDGSNETILVSGLSGPLGIALDLAGGRMYWSDSGDGDIRRANLDGSGQKTLVRGL